MPGGVFGLFEPEQSDAVDPFALARAHGIEDRCQITQGRGDLPALYAAMDVFVMPSHREGLSKSLLEATAMARPTVACDIRGCREVVIDGVRILRYRDAMVHAKTATVDGTWSTVGTANIDRLSLSGNYEVNVEVIDAGLAGELERIFTVDESNAALLTSIEWETRDVHRRFTEAFLQPLRPLL